jgi:Arc/MetJ-type ribon-helix-helix transcriptional regulator
MTNRSEKFSVSVPSDLARFVEEYRATHNLDSRSEVIAKALERLREEELALEYRAAGEEWAQSEDAALWDRVVGDGLES